MINRMGDGGTERMGVPQRTPEAQARGMGRGSGQVIRVRALRKAYGTKAALDGVDLDVDRGEVVALLGPNGAGKTTTVEVLEGFRSRTAGEVAVLDEDPEHGSRAWRARIGVVLQDLGSFDELRVREVVRHWSHFLADPLDPDEVIELVALSDKAGSLGKTLSGGQRRRLDVAVGLVGRPELLFLDEPTTGLDPEARRAVWDLIGRLTALGTTVLLTSHLLDEVEALADRVLVIVDGRVVAAGTPRTLGGRSDAQAVVAFDRPTSDRPLPSEVTGSPVEVDGRRCRITTDRPTAVVAGLSAWAGAAELPGLTVSRPTLEDVYLSLVAHRELAGAGR